LDLRAIKVRADGGNTIGLGHWSRCLFLLDCAPDYRKIIYTQFPEDFRAAFASADVEVMNVTSDMEFVEQVTAQDVVIVDKYNLPDVFLSSLKATDAIVICIDDLIASKLFADFVINHSEGVSSLEYKQTFPYTTFLLGGQYSLVSPIFHSGGISAQNRVRSLLISMGGADPYNFTVRVILENKAFIESFESVDIIIGLHYAYIRELTAIDFLKEKANIHQGLNKKEVARLMAKAGVAILSASTMAVEYAQIGGLLTVVKTADNQNRLFKGLIRSKAACELKELTELSGLTSAYNYMIADQKTIFDGLSQNRFRKLFQELRLQKKMVLRKASIDDVQLTYAWATDPVIRTYAYSRHLITIEEHESWFSRRINNTDCLYFIGEIDHKPVGSIRFDIKNGNATISYLVDGSEHGKGIGRILLACGIKILLENRNDINILTGYVMKANEPSVKIFERLGFESEETQSQYPHSIKFSKEIK
jgi:UDP-2,4-diacetamido-2,4,6-trideoxy-beta-L-altropyranose hydrolase